MPMKHCLPSTTKYSITLILACTFNNTFFSYFFLFIYDILGLTDVRKEKHTCKEPLICQGCLSQPCQKTKKQKKIKAPIMTVHKCQRCHAGQKKLFLYF